MPEPKYTRNDNEIIDFAKLDLDRILPKIRINKKHKTDIRTKAISSDRETNRSYNASKNLPTLSRVSM